MLAALAGTVTGYLYRTDTPFFLPSLTRPRRLWRPLKEYRIPLSLHHLLARVFSPLVGQSAPPRRANRVLPGQVRDAPATDAAEIVRGLLANRGLAAAPPVPRRLDAPAAEGGLGLGGLGGLEAPSPAPSGSGSARAAVGEWVNDLTGRGAARAPTEQEISALSNMFPNLSRETVVRALQRNDHNTALAIEDLLQQGS